MKYKQMLKIRKTEKDPQVRDRILLNVLVKRDGMSVTGAARIRLLGCSRNRFLASQNGVNLPGSVSFEFGSADLA